MINIKHFGDVHANEHFYYGRLARIEDAICNDKTDYIMFTGDLIDSNEYISRNPVKGNKLLKWIERLSSTSKFIMVPGNHDIFSKEDGEWIYDVDIAFWKELASIEGVSFLPICEKYEDELIHVTGIDLGYDYYEKYKMREDKEELLEELRSIREKLVPVDGKLNVLLSHSPVYLTDQDVVEQIKSFDLILSGHMHNGCVIPSMERFFPKNRGLISPKRGILPNNARGTIDLSNGSKLVITGGITKIANSSLLNSLFPMEITEIEYNPEDKKSTVRRLQL